MNLTYEPAATLAVLGLIDASQVEVFWPRVRDRADVQVLRCRATGVIFLTDAPAEATDYALRSDFTYWSAGSREAAVAACARDDERRSRDFESLIRQRRWMDVGTGAGGILDRLKSVAATVAAVEPHPAARTALLREGYSVFSDVSEAPESSWDVVSLFHVLEHLRDPLSTLQAVRARLVQDGTVIIEVPHARDFLIEQLACRPFKDFTFWSEHLVLHTRASLRGLLLAAGFRDVSVTGLQRYPLENHLHWLAKSEPGGHDKWATIGTPALATAYAATLAAHDMTDTLVATARR